MYLIRSASPTAVSGATVEEEMRLNANIDKILKTLPSSACCWLVGFLYLKTAAAFR